MGFKIIGVANKVLNFVKDRIDYFFGRGKHSIFVPVMDGAFKPNEFLDNVKVKHKEEDIDNLIINGSTILFSGKSTLFSMASMNSWIYEDDIGKMCSFLVSKDSERISGQIIGVDGNAIRLD